MRISDWSSDVCSSDLLAGDEFTLFFPQLPAAETAQRISRAVQYALGERFDVGGQQIDLGASIGVAFYPQHGETLHALLRSADMAMYQAKENGRNRVEFFSDELAKEMAGRAERSEEHTSELQSIMRISY